ncbi:MAG: leucyl/phenylalanyl-tRNA--protein transferase [Betaproteobacteria bacterium HGW-Betaproteobacteria-18]|nr:MAG: leucyl/phenylalanyl-tRNA--protein transferase [Betaproteobacteria bacterium HGW-Betaproteobacteria-18]
MRYQAALRPDCRIVIAEASIFGCHPHASTWHHRKMTQAPAPLPWLVSGEPFPPVNTAWGSNSVAPGLLCAGADLSVGTLKSAYQNGIYPWFSADQPILWWSPAPRMVLEVSQFKLRPSLKKILKKFAGDSNCEIRIDTAFAQVIQACASSPRQGAHGTWIVPDMINAYIDLHHAGLAHSIETWNKGQLVGGLYCVAIGQAVFGESMFYRSPNASKIALAALVSLCRHYKISQIDCQQNTAHLQSLGAHELARAEFTQRVHALAQQPAIDWRFQPLYWRELFTFKPDSA